MNKILSLLPALLLAIQACGQSAPLPEGFVYLKEVVPSIINEPRYYSDHNFMGRPVEGYEAPKIIITRAAAVALKKVQEDLSKAGLGLKVYDGYRPQRAVDDFVAWAKDLDDTLRKAEYYPNIPKRLLFDKGYIAVRSGHSRGSTVDVTLTDLSSGKELTMGTPYDFFSPRSWPTNKGVSVLAQENRRLLQKVLTRHGFEPLSTEWWHFTLRDEPFPKTYFDFVVK